MRKRSEKQKEKDGESPEKKTVRRLSQRNSKRRKNYRSPSPEAEDSGADEGEPQCRIKSEKQDEKLECTKESNEILKSDKKKTDTSKSTEKKLTGCEEDWKEDTAFWSEENPQGQVPNENTEQMQKNVATTEVTDTDEGSQSISETGRSFVFEPKTKRTKRTRRRSATSGCDDGEAASGRATCNEIAASSAIENEEQRGRTKSESDNGPEMSASKRDRVASDCAQGSDLSEANGASGSEVKLNEKSSEQDHRNSTDERSEHEGTGEEKLFVGLHSEVVQKEKTLEEKIADICNDSSCDKSDTECDNSFQTDISEGMTKEKVLELLGDDSSAVQNSSRLESDRETSDESAVQRDAIKDDSNASRASSETPSKESAVPRRRSSSDSADLQSNRQMGDCGSSEEGGKMELLDEKKPLTKETASPPDKQQSEADDSTKETDSANEKHLQKTDKHLGKPHETVHSSVKNDIISSDKLKTEEVKVKPKRIKLCRTSRDSNSYTAANKETKRHSPESHENQKPVKLSRRSRSPESSQKSRRRESDPQEPRSPVHRYERVVLRRSFPEKSVSRSEGDTGTVSHDETKTDATDDKDNKENEKLASNRDVAAAGSISRKRRWGASKTSRANKKPVLSISSDSLKNLIPGAKPLSAGEVQLTEDDTSKDVKIEVEENWSVKSPEEKELIRPLAMMPDTSRPTTSAADDHSRFAVRKISIVSDDARTLQRSPSPPKNKVSNILFITNLVRPFTLHQLKDLLARTGTIVEDGFWIDRIKSKCYVQYETEVQARETRHALHGVRWPVSNPKQLCVDFGRKEDMEAAKAAKDTDSIPRKTEPIQLERVPPQSLPIQGGNIPLVENWVVSQQLRDKERDRERERERGRVKDRATALPEQRTPKVPPAVREWDLGKVGQMSPEIDSRSEERTKDRERKSRKDKPHRSRSTSPSDISARKSKKKEDDAPAKLLDDLFRKTKTTPCIYWLPLTAEQIVVKEEMRRKHMAEHERRMAEMRKAERERERERARAQQRPHRRSGGGAGDRERDRERERDRRSGRRRSASGSPKK